MLRKKKETEKKNFQKMAHENPEKRQGDWCNISHLKPPMPCSPHPCPNFATSSFATLSSLPSLLGLPLT
jgi:hypothetical protein